MAPGLLAGFGWSLLQPSTYSATASVALTPVPIYVTAVDRRAASRPRSASTPTPSCSSSPQVLRGVGDALGTDAEPAVEHLSRHRVTQQPRSPRDRDGRLPHARPPTPPNAAVAAFIDVRRDALGALASDQLRQLRLLVTDQEDAAGPGAGQPARRSRPPTTCSPRLLELRTGLDELEEARSEPARVVRPACRPRAPDYANTEVPIDLGRDARAARRLPARRRPRPPPAPWTTTRPHSETTVRRSCRMLATRHEDTTMP